MIDGKSRGIEVLMGGRGAVVKLQIVFVFYKGRWT